MAAKRRAVAVAVAILASLMLSASPAAACTGCAATFDDFVGATNSIVLAEWKGRADGKDTFAVVDVLRGPAIREVTLYAEYLEGKAPGGRWLLVDQGYLGLLRVSVRGRVAGGFTDDSPSTLAGWYAAIRRMPDTATPPAATKPTSFDPMPWLIAGACGFLVGCRRFWRPRVRRARRHGPAAIACGVIATILVAATGASFQPASAASISTRTQTIPARLHGPTLRPVQGEVPCLTVVMHQPRYEAVTVALADGRALILGGYDVATDWDENAHPIASYEIFDAKANTFIEGGRIPGNVWPYSATLLADGRVLILSTGGWPLLFDPRTDTFAKAGRPVRLRYAVFTVRLKDGRVLVVGGSPYADGTPMSELFDPTDGSWSVTGSMHTFRLHPGVALLPDGRVLVAGGDMGFGEGELDIFHRSSELYDPAMGRFVGARPMPEERTEFSAVTLKDGRVLLAGDPVIGDPTLAELFDPRTGRYSRTGKMLESSPGPASRLASGRVLVLGDAVEDLSDPDAEVYRTLPSPAQVYDPAKGTFSSLELLNPFEMDQYSAVVLRDGRVLITGDTDAALVCSP